MNEIRPFVHLHVHSYYSLLDGLSSVKTLVDKAIADGQPAIALTDHGAMYGIKEFYNYVCQKNKPHISTIKDCTRELNELLDKGDLSSEEEERIEKLRGRIEKSKSLLFKPILGCEAYCARRSRHEKNAKEPDPYRPTRSIDAGGWHIILLAKNLIGYRNLIKMVSLSWIEGEYYRPRIDKELLEKYHEGIIVCSACLGGEIPQHIMNGRNDRAIEAAEWFKRVFGDDFYLEVQLHPTTSPTANRDTYPQQKHVAEAILEIAKELDIKVVATNDVHFANAEDAEAHKRLLWIGTGNNTKERGTMLYTEQEWLKTQQEMNEIFAEMPDVLENSLEIADKIEYYSIDNPPLMPAFEIPQPFTTEDEYLRHLVYKGAEERYPQPFSEELVERIDFELGVIEKMGFPGYFLIVQDFISQARKMGVSVGPGRGSAAGSVVAYCLGIISIDPIKYDLLFERFLNPDRTSLPDIDVDFDEDGRSRVLQWVTQKYGEECVAHVITYGAMATKGAIRDVARVECLPIKEADRLTKLIPESIEGEKSVTLPASIRTVPELQIASNSPMEDLRNTLKYASQLEGTVRQTGIHACGMIIGSKDISDVVPIRTSLDNKTGERVVVTQYEGKVIEETGLIKMDFLGLKTLSIILDALRNIEHSTGKKIDIDKIPIDDPKVYRLYSDGRTIGTFQFESAGMRKYLRELQPTTFEDLIAMNALFRPGPMQYIPTFIDRKHGRKPIEYEIPEMERYLKDTYGVTVYQEQVMLLSRQLAGFTRGESDSLRKAMGKKLIDKMAALKTKFLDGGEKNGHNRQVLEKIWSDWEEFAKYAFNKSHATCYSWVAYQTAYLKAHYPAEYMAATLSRNLDDIAELSKLMDECQAMGLEVITPNINESLQMFSVDKKGRILFGLNGIKGVSSHAVEAIIEERNMNGPFQDVFDFVERIDMSDCNRKTMEAFVLSGAFDVFELEREAYLAPMSEGKEDTFLIALVKYSNLVKKNRGETSFSIFGDSIEAQIPRPKVPGFTPWSTLHKLSQEKSLVGMYLSANPLEEYQFILEKYCNTQTTDFEEIENLANKQIVMAGIVNKVHMGTDKKNRPFAFITIEDYAGTYEIRLFGQQYVSFGNYAKENLYLLVKGQVQARFYNPNLFDFNITSIDLLPNVADSMCRSIQVDIPISAISDEFIQNFSEKIEENPGNVPLNIRLIDPTDSYTVTFKSVSIHPNMWLSRCLDQYEIPYQVE